MTERKTKPLTREEEEELINTFVTSKGVTKLTTFPPGSLSSGIFYVLPRRGRKKDKTFNKTERP